jgi:hypothetical protein
MRTVLLIVTAVAALAVSGQASAAPTEGVHGAGVVDFEQFGFQGKYTFSLDATRTSTGAVVGYINFFVRDTELIDFGWFQAEPTYLAVDGNSACVVGNITRLTNWYDMPIITVLNVVDVPNGPDMVGVLNIYSPIDPAFACTLNAPTLQLTGGNLTVLP